MNTQLEKQQDSRAEAVQQRPAVAPRVDIFENKDEVLLVADMPGVGKDGLNVHLDHEQLTVEGRVMTDTGNGRFLAREWRPFDYRRSFLVPKGIDTEKVSAEKDVMAILTFAPVYDNGDGSNKDWSKWTPQGKLEMTVTNPTAIATTIVMTKHDTHATIAVQNVCASSLR